MEGAVEKPGFVAMVFLLSPWSELELSSGRERRRLRRARPVNKIDLSIVV